MTHPLDACPFVRRSPIPPQSDPRPGIRPGPICRVRLTAPPILAYPTPMGKTLIALAALLALAAPAGAHLGEPTVKTLRFPESRAEAPWFVVDNVGLLALDGGWRWLCDEGISPEPGLEDLAPVDADGRIWLAATRSGLRRTTDAGCSFVAVPGFEEHTVGHLSPDPSRPGRAVIGTTTVGGPPNDVWYSDDAGETWQAAGLGLEGRVRGLLRADADPDVIYVIHTQGAVRSDDGGRTFTPIALGPPAADGRPEPTGTDIVLLATDPADPRVVWSAFVRFPTSDLLRSTDGGETWAAMASFSDGPDTLIIDPASGDMLLAMALEGLRRSTDGGETWIQEFFPEPRAWVDCLTRGPEGRLWACIRRDAPYMVAVSDDFGVTWSGQFAADFTEIEGGWACPADSPTAAACAEACDRATEDCSAQADAGPPDGGVVDSGPPDAGEVVPTPTDDCTAAPGSTPGWPALACVLLLAIGRRR